jgi:hypothetical protein
MCKAWLRKKSHPKWVVPTLATLTNERFSHEGWLFEPKWDGERHPCGAVAAIIIANAMTLPRAARNEGTLVLKKFGDAQQVPQASRARARRSAGQRAAAAATRHSGSRSRAAAARKSG